MNESNRIEIELSKTKLIKLLVFSVLFLGIGLWMIIANPQIKNPIFGNIIVKTIASYGSTIMGIFGLYYFSKKLFDKEPGIIISEEGIYDNSSIYKFGLIPWSEITGVYEKIVQVANATQYFITFELVNPQKYIENETNPLKRKLIEVNAKNYGSPIHISTNGLKTNHQELFNLIKEYYEKYSNSI